MKISWLTVLTLKIEIGKGCKTSNESSSTEEEIRIYENVLFINPAIIRCLLQKYCRAQNSPGVRPGWTKKLKGISRGWEEEREKKMSEKIVRDIDQRGGKRERRKGVCG